MNSVPEKFLQNLSRRFSTAWRDADRYRALRPAGHQWDEAVFLPMAAWSSIGCETFGVQELSVQQFEPISQLFFASAWRPRQDIIRFDPDVYSSLIATSLEGNLPSEILWRLPSWCVYVETPGLQAFGEAWDGFMAALEESWRGRDLRLLFLKEEAGGPGVMGPIIIELGDWTLEEGLTKFKDKVEANDPGWEKLLRERGIEQAVNLLLYVCSYGLEDKEGWGVTGAVAYPKAKKVKMGWRLFPPDRPTVHVLGETYGAQIRKARDVSGSVAHHGSPRPHVRRAHWHGFWTGPLKPRPEGGSLGSANFPCAGCHRSRWPCGMKKRKNK